MDNKKLDVSMTTMGIILLLSYGLKYNSKNNNKKEKEDKKEETKNLEDKWSKISLGD